MSIKLKSVVIDNSCVCNAMNYLPSKALTAVVVLATGAGAKAAAEPMMVAMIADFILI